MPKYRIPILPDIVFLDLDERPIMVDGIKAEEGIGGLTFGRFLKILLRNPLWGESYDHGEAQSSILASFKEAQARGQDYFDLAEADHKLLAHAAKLPRTVVTATDDTGKLQNVVENGLGFHPALASQLVPYQRAIIKAASTN